MRNRSPLIVLPLLATAAVHAQTTMEVPQGSGVFPTIGQINCLEELGSGRFCAATYECAERERRIMGGYGESRRSPRHWRNHPGGEQEGVYD